MKCETQGCTNQARGLSYFCNECETIMTKTKYYVSFGGSHIHKYNKETLDRNILFCIEALDEAEASSVAKRLFGDKWSMIYSEKEVKFEYYPRGVFKAFP